MKKSAHDPIVVALALFGLLFLAMMAFLAGAAIRKRAQDARLAQPWMPPGWVSPTLPPPSTK